MRHFLLIISLFISTVMMAGPVDQETARQKAKNFVANKMGSKAQRSMKVTESGIKKTSNRAADAQGYLHVFNIDGGGYVIVSGDDRTEEILGYSTTGTFDAEKMPENMRAFLQEYVDGIQYLKDHNVQKTTTGTPQKVRKGDVRRVAKTSIDPLINARWNQGDPYNQFCPAYSGDLAATGCVATAFAQVMNHHKWPKFTTTEIPAYTSYTRSFKRDAIPAGTAIDWDNINDKYGWVKENGTWNKYTYTDAQGQAVANLMKLCGQAVEMDYYCDDNGSSGASTPDCITALVKYFDYEESTCKWLSRVNYSYSDWQDIIYAELAANRPVLYSGQSAGGGHAFVCDGYDSADFFHINWGWGGSSDGFFRLCILNPDDQGIGGSSTSDGYGMGQGVGIGIQKNDGISNPITPKIQISSLQSKETTFTRTSSPSNFSLNSNLTYSVTNRTDGELTFDLKARILNSSNSVVEEINLLNAYTLGSWYRTPSLSFPDFGANYANGTYKLVLIAKNSGESDWYVLDDGLTCLDFTISGNTMEIASAKLEVSHEIEGNLSVNSPQTIKINVKNTGTKAYRRDLYYILNDEWYRAGFVDAEPNTTSTVVFEYTPTSSGTYSFTLDPLEYQFNMTIEGGSGAPNLTGTYNGATPAIQYDSSTGKYYVNGTSTKASFTVTNTGDGDFNDNILFYFWYYSNSESDWVSSKATSSVTLAPGASKNYNVTIDQDDNSDYSLYCVEMRWMVNGKATFLAGTPDFEFRTPTTYIIETGEYGSTPEMKYDDATNTSYIEGSKVTFYGDIKNIGVEDFTGQLQIDRWYRYATGWDWTTETLDLTVAAGATKRVNIDMEKNEADLYCLFVSYKGPNESNFEYLLGTPDFEFRTVTTKPGDANGDGVVNVSDIVLTVNYIMGKNPANFNKDAADLTGDGEVNVTDIVKMVNIIMEAASRRDAGDNKPVFEGKSILLKNLGIEGKPLFDALNDERASSDVSKGISTDIPKEGQVKP